MPSLFRYTVEGSIHPRGHPSNDGALYNTTAIHLGSTGHPYDQYLPFGVTEMGLGNASSVIESQILASQQKWNIQVLATVASSISVTAALTAVYWFCMMRRNFRRDLILFLIIGDVFKSMWYLIFAIVTFVSGPVSTTSPFCQVSGYMLGSSIELCDLAILFMSMHMALLIFPPSWSILGHDGLYRVRHYVYAAWILLPQLMAALAFINGRDGYMVAGAFCWLPVRPFWYRLALSWVPRYLIWIYVMGVAIRIYKHVGYEFRIFAHERDQSSSVAMTAESSIDRAAALEINTRANQLDGATMREDRLELAPDEKIDPSPPELAQESFKSLPFNPARRQSVPSWPTTFGGTAKDEPFASSRSNPGSRRGSRVVTAGVLAEDFAPPFFPNSFDFSRHRGSESSVGSLHSIAEASLDGTKIPALPSIEEGGTTQAQPADAQLNVAQLALQQRRRAIQRQLRLLFIYPCVYMIIWLIPFVSHCFNYSDYYAQHPIYVISALSTFCQTSLGWVDVLIFCWREKPWRHIPGSDGTFLGSFCWWRFTHSAQWNQSRHASVGANRLQPQEYEKSQSQAGLLASIKKYSFSQRSSKRPPSTSSSRPTITHKRTFSGGSDRRAREAERAHERLALERREYEENRNAMQERRASVISARPQTKEWFDRKSSEDLLESEEQQGQGGV